jgi:hypothetical protein
MRAAATNGNTVQTAPSARPFLALVRNTTEPCLKTILALLVLFSNAATGMLILGAAVPLPPIANRRTISDSSQRT